MTIILNDNTFYIQKERHSKKTAKLNSCKPSMYGSLFNGMPKSLWSTVSTINNIFMAFQLITVMLGFCWLNWNDSLNYYRECIDWKELKAIDNIVWHFPSKSKRSHHILGQSEKSLLETLSSLDPKGQRNISVQPALKTR